MTKQELNEIIAEFMGLKRGVDFGDMCMYCRDNYGGFCGSEPDGARRCWEHGYKPAPDYTAAENWVALVEKLKDDDAIENIDISFGQLRAKTSKYIHVTILFYKGRKRFDYAYGKDDTIGESVCRAVAEYFKAVTK